MLSSVLKKFIIFLIFFIFDLFKIFLWNAILIKIYYFSWNLFLLFNELAILHWELFAYLVPEISILIYFVLRFDVVPKMPIFVVAFWPNNSIWNNSHKIFAFFLGCTTIVNNRYLKLWRIFKQIFEIVFNFWNLLFTLRLLIQIRCFNRTNIL